MKNSAIIIITGLSGSGKSTSLQALEDMGFFCVDNLPVELLPKFLELPLSHDTAIQGLAFVMDLREKNFLSQYDRIFSLLKQNGYHFTVIYLEADETTLVRRYSQTRRNHPLSKRNNPLDGIRAEIQQLSALRIQANRVINTSVMNVHELRSELIDIARHFKKIALPKISIRSFGFKYGIPGDADLIVDVRFLKNPYFVPHLSALSGLNDDVSRFVLSTPEAKVFLQKYLDLLDFLIPLYEKEGKFYLTIAVGCTGGRHRSVVIAHELFNHIHHSGKPVEINHRDVGL